MAPPWTGGVASGMLWQDALGRMQSDVSETRESWFALRIGSQLRKQFSHHCLCSFQLNSTAPNGTFQSLQRPSSTGALGLWYRIACGGEHPPHFRAWGLTEREVCPRGAGGRDAPRAGTGIALSCTPPPLHFPATTTKPPNRRLNLAEFADLSCRFVGFLDVADLLC